MSVVITEEYEQTYEDETTLQEELVLNTSTKPKLKSIIMNVSGTQYPIVKYVGNVIMEWKLQYETDNSNWDMWWTDQSVQPETLCKMKSHQKINHFPGMYILARKNYLGKTLMKMRKKFPEDYDFFPKTWTLPAEINEFKAYYLKTKNKTFIVKPEASCQGRGIFLTKSLDWTNNVDRLVVQKYKSKPLLLEGLKFDLRIYVLVAGCDPLRLYLYTEGLTRMATELYQKPNAQNINIACMHLTNYAINKENDKFVFNEDEENMNIGHKRSLSSVFETLRSQGRDVDLLWMEIKNIVIKTLCAGQPLLKHQYTSSQPSNTKNNMCFEILGFDIFITEKQVNHTPSFNSDTPLDTYIKQNLIQDTLVLMNITTESKMTEINFKRDEMNKRMLTGKNNRLTLEERQSKIQKIQLGRDYYEDQNLGGYEKIYPLEVNHHIKLQQEYKDDFIQYIQHAQLIQEEQTGTNVRRTPSKKLPVDSQNLQRVDDIQKIYSQMGAKYKQPTTAAQTWRYHNSPIQKRSSKNSHVQLLKSQVSIQKAQQNGQKKVSTSFIVGGEDEIKQSKIPIIEQTPYSQLYNELSTPQQLPQEHTNNMRQITRHTQQQQKKPLSKNLQQLQKMYFIISKYKLPPRLINIFTRKILLESH